VIPPQLQAKAVRFGPFELDLRTCCLTRGGRQERLAVQPTRLLVLLVQRQGELVTREELRSQLWPDDTFGDFDHGLNNAMNRVREALGDSAASPRYIQTAPRRGYRFIADVEVVAPARIDETDASSPGVSTCGEEREAAAVPDVEELDASDRREPAVVTATGQTWFRRREWILALIIPLFLLFAFLLKFRTHKSDPAAPIRSLAVLPLRNLSGNPNEEYFADGMTEEVIGRLSMIRGLRVISRTSVMQFKDTRLSAPEIARKLGADALVEGSVMREGNRIRVHAQLIRASTDEHFWSESYDRELGDALTLESEVAQSIAQRVEVTVSGEEHARLVAAHPVSPEAYESYLQGMFAKGNSRAETERRIAWFDDAIKKDPAFAQAYVGLASAYGALGTVFVGAPASETRPKVINAARKALELDPDLADAHVLLADIYMRQWKWAEAEAEYRRALDLNPNDAAAHDGFSDWLLCHGHMDEALAWARRARDLDPLGPSGHTIAWTLLNARRYDEAIRQFRDVLAVRPDDRFPLWPLGWALICNHQAEEAIPVLEKAVSVTNRSPGVISALIWAYANAGRRADALRLLGELKKRRQTGYIPAGAFVDAYLGLGDNDEAFAWFERAFEEQSNILIYIKVFPLYDPLRGDSRFQDLVRRVGLD
jgi:TolB-like protein/DNA-binding winged helix-turn-helix (wHTH) protein/tetratricopeptide (TPR) repeat protein